MKKPVINSPYIAANATVVGDVRIEKDASIWYGAVLRGDKGAITVGEGTNIQDNCVVHEHTTVGRDCTVGHGAILHGCTVGDSCLIGMGAIVLNEAVLGEHCLVGAGALVTARTVAPAGSLLLGSPAKVIKPLTPEQIAEIREDAQLYKRLSKEHFGG